MSESEEIEEEVEEPSEEEEVFEEEEADSGELAINELSRMLDVVEILREAVYGRADVSLLLEKVKEETPKAVTRVSRRRKRSKQTK